jgi:hypothetical protein
MRRMVVFSSVLLVIVLLAVHARSLAESLQPDEAMEATAKDVKALQGYWRLKELNINNEKIEVPDYLARMHIAGIS